MPPQPRTSTALAAVAVLTGVLAITTQPAAGRPTAAVVARGSLQCFAEVPGVTVDGVPATFRYEDGRSRTEVRGPDDLGYQPRDLAFPHLPESGHAAAGVTGQAAPVTSHWFTLSGAELREVTEVDRRNKHGVLVSASYDTSVVRKNWGGVRQISIGEDREHLYVLTNTDQLLRYRITGKDGNVSVKLDTTVGVGFGTIGTLTYERTDVDDVRTDVFLATDADAGELLEIAIPVDAPTDYTRTVLATEGWAEMRSIGRTASCLNPHSGRNYDGIVSVDVDGEVRMWTDRDGADADGSDILRRAVLKADWRPLAYSD